jgi:hypothetical protein
MPYPPLREQSDGRRWYAEISQAMLSLIKNYQIKLANGTSRYVAASTVDDAGPNVNFICINRIVHSQPKQEMQSYYEWTTTPDLSRKKPGSAA